MGFFHAYFDQVGGEGQSGTIFEQFAEIGIVHRYSVGNFCELQVTSEVITDDGLGN
ncbi:hypothetical protein D3C87_2095300 [compost metagenome]